MWRPLSCENSIYQQNLNIPWKGELGAVKISCMHRLIYVKNEILPILLAASVEWVTIWNWSELGRKRSKRKAMADKKKKVTWFCSYCFDGYHWLIKIHFYWYFAFNNFSSAWKYSPEDIELPSFFIDDIHAYWLFWSRISLTTRISFVAHLFLDNHCGSRFLMQDAS